MRPLLCWCVWPGNCPWKMRDTSWVCVSEGERWSWPERGYLHAQYSSALSAHLLKSSLLLSTMLMASGITPTFTIAAGGGL
jgi:hypothetical protein